MRLVALAFLGLALVMLAACGNNRMREDWDGARDTINKPFK